MSNKNAPKKASLLDRCLNAVERAGNALPHPVTLFAIMALAVVVISAICAAMGVYWPGLDFIVTSPQVTIPEYLESALKQGITHDASVSVIVGDFQRIDLYAKLGYQLPQEIPEKAWEAFHTLVDMGYNSQLAKES